MALSSSQNTTDPGFSIGASLSFGGGQGVTGSVAAGAGSTAATTPCATGNCPGAPGNSLVLVIILIAVAVLLFR